MWTYNTGVVSLIPPCVTFKTPLVRKAAGNHLMNSTSLENLRALSLVSAALEIEYATPAGQGSIPGRVTIGSLIIVIIINN